MNNELKEDLKGCETLNQMWATLDEYYNLDKPLGTITKGVVINNFIRNLGTLIKATRTPER